jgi:hypothetical protein
MEEITPAPKGVTTPKPNAETIQTLQKQGKIKFTIFVEELVSFQKGTNIKNGLFKFLNVKEKYVCAIKCIATFYFEI